MDNDIEMRRGLAKLHLDHEVEKNRSYYLAMQLAAVRWLCFAVSASTLMLVAAHGVRVLGLVP